jgi:transcriptional regulator with XRE-family HTH domain
LTVEDVVRRLKISPEQYYEMEMGSSAAEEWGPRLSLIAIALQTPTSRLIAENGKFAQAGQVTGQCGSLIRSRRERAGLSKKDLADKVQLSVAEMESIENGVTPLEVYAPLLLGFAETVDLPIFNLFYPCGLPLAQLTNYS